MRHLQIQSLWFNTAPLISSETHSIAVAKQNTYELRGAGTWAKDSQFSFWELIYLLSPSLFASQRMHSLVPSSTDSRRTKLGSFLPIMSSK